MINDYVLDLFLGEEKIYLSYDSLYLSNLEIVIADDIHTRLMDTINNYGLPNHKLKFKFGVLVMLLRNIDQSLGLSNGTRPIITKMGEYVVEGKVI